MNTNTVYVLFKTHFDLGFTDLAAPVLEKYLTDFVPKAVATGRALEGTDTPFVWTLPSYVLQLALERDADGTVDAACRDGILSWNAAPCTFHTEFMSERLFTFALSLSRDLDRRYGRATTGMKMTDVPGHTVGIVPLAARAGIKFLHVGLNPSSPKPPVPTLFRWKCGADELLVVYSAGSYGRPFAYEDFAVEFAHTNDNLGPQSPEEVREVYARLREKYPGARVRAATLSDIAERLSRVRAEIPVISQEIGDTWVYGDASDPWKTAAYRALLRAYDAAPASVEGPALRDSLLLIPEHTCGANIQQYYRDREHYRLAEFEALGMTEGRVFLEKSWEEQRDYARAAAPLLGVDLAKELDPAPPAPASFSPASAPAELPFEFVFQLYNADSYRRFRQDYSIVDEPWVDWDFSRLGLPDYDAGSFEPGLVETLVRGDETLYRLRFGPELTREHGLPTDLSVLVSPSLVTVYWSGLRAHRLPIAFWFRLKGFDAGLELSTLGQWIRPDDILGSPLLTAVDGRGVRADAGQVIPLDSALVAPHGRHLLEHNIGRQPVELWFNLYNNHWNTNFPVWFSDDMKFRFLVKRNAPDGTR